MGNGVAKGGWCITDVWYLNIIYYLCGSTHLNEVSLHLKSYDKEGMFIGSIGMHLLGKQVVASTCNGELSRLLSALR